MPRARTSRTVLIQVRLPEKLLRKLDRLVEEGWYKNRTAAVEDAVRRLVARFASAKEPGKAVLWRMEGKLLDVDPLKVVLDPEVRKDIAKAFGTDDLDEVMGMVRRRSA